MVSSRLGARSVVGGSKDAESDHWKRRLRSENAKKIFAYIIEISKPIEGTNGRVRCAELNLAEIAIRFGFCRTYIYTTFMRDNCLIVPAEKGLGQYYIFEYRGDALAFKQGPEAFLTNCINNSRGELRESKGEKCADVSQNGGAIQTGTGVDTVHSTEVKRGFVPIGMNEMNGEADGLIWKSAQMREVMELIKLGALFPVNILLTGETGVGKELCARRIHDLSSRNKMPFVAVTCSAIPETLIESELFGYEKGAFTDAKSRRPGAFERANGGTIFLDEIGDLSLLAQAKILRVLQEREVAPIGGGKRVVLDVRLVAATNKDLRAAVLNGGFRKDLYYRLDVHGIHVPPLRERPEDIALLLKYFISRFTKEMRANITSIASDVIDRCVLYAWPGNVRQLENAACRAILLSCKGREERLIAAHFPVLDDSVIGGYGEFFNTLPSRVVSVVDEEGAIRPFKTIERDVIAQALEAANWDKKIVASRFDMGFRTIKYKMREYNIRRRQSADGAG